ncbi:hypothetical protein KBC04_01050 [Candidatus Babeliales bacterium]|nr:hypothetical protein [Candidatus Babeliales bacterium]MBP9843677.1 hypothetical protein [Candidatus Babeliales bacterium]
MNKIFIFFFISSIFSSSHAQDLEPDKLLVAWHEAGHALAFLHNQELGSMHHVTICPDQANKSLGHVMSFHLKFVTFNIEQTEQEIITCLCGGVAEQIYRNQQPFKTDTEIHQYFSHGKFLSDIQQARQKAYDFFTVNSVQYYNSKQIEQKIKTMIANLYYQAYQFLAPRKDQLKKIAETLLQKNFLSHQEIYDLIKII